MNIRTINYLVSGLIILIPVFFWSLTPNFISTPKEIILTIAVLSALLVTSYTLIKDHRLALPKTSELIPLVAFVLAIVATLIFNPEGRPESIASKGTVLIFLPLLTIIVLGDLTESVKQLFVHLIIAVSGVLSLHSLLSLTFLHRSPYLPDYMQTITFTPTGSYLTTLVIILVGISLAATHFKHAATSLKPWLGTALVLGSIATVAITSLMLPGSALSPALISHTASWNIALDALKSFRALFFGIGLSNYSLLYSAVKPISINLTPLWNTLPSSATSEFLTLLPTAGIVPLLGLLYIMYRTTVASLRTPLLLPYLILLLAFFLIPGSLSLYFFLFLFYALATHKHSSTHHLEPALAYSLAAVVVAATLSAGYITSRVYASEYLIRQAQLSLNSNNSQRVYDLHLRAIRLSPSITNYHLSFAEINFRLASALSQKQELTDSDRDIITRLVQQSIESGKTAISLRPNDHRTWLAVAKIYQNLINIAEGAENFAAELYAKALSLDRANPLLHLEYGMLLSQIADSQEDEATIRSLRSRAIASVQTSIQLKSDYANGYYNLAKLYESVGELEGAVIALQTSLKYLVPQSPDYLQVQNELVSLQAKQTKSTTIAPSPSPVEPVALDTTELTTPSPLPSPLDGGPIEIINE